MKIEVSAGDLLDRYSILLIKSEKGLGVDDHIDAIEPQCVEVVEKCRDDFDALLNVNRQLWHLEDLQRKHRTTKDLGSEYVNTTIAIFENNEDRAYIKQRIDKTVGDKLAEKKSYF